MVTKTVIGHTPGPWVVDSNGPGHEVVLAPCSYGSHTVAAVHGTDDPAENLANAHVIAAAPKMLAALYAVVNTDKLASDSLEREVAMAMVTTSIAGAEGR